VVAFDELEEDGDVSACRNDQQHAISGDGYHVTLVETHINGQLGIGVVTAHGPKTKPAFKFNSLESTIDRL